MNTCKGCKYLKIIEHPYDDLGYFALCTNQDQDYWDRINIDGENLGFLKVIRNETDSLNWLRNFECEWRTKDV